MPSKPYHTDDLSLGIRIASAKSAIQSRYIQHNGPTHKHWLVFDIDHQDAATHWQAVGAPEPNIIAINPHNGHGHLFYGLETPVRTATDGKIAPIRYAAAVEAALRNLLRGDDGYSGLISKNPLHPHWFVKTYASQLYGLDELCATLDLSAYNGKRKIPVTGLGRNVQLFEQLSKWAYRAIRQGWPDYEPWLLACLDKAFGLNIQIGKNSPSGSLHENEVRHTARSVAKWCHKNLSPAGFSAAQARRGSKGGKIGGKISRGGGRPALPDETVTKFMMLRVEGYNNAQIARMTKHSRATVIKSLAGFDPSEVVRYGD